MIRNISKSRYLLTGMVVLLAALFAAGCSTTFEEKSGKMPNESASKHVKGYSPNSSQAIRPLTPLRGLQ